MEEDRIEFLQKNMLKENKQHVFILAKTCCEYIQQGYFGQTLEIHTYVDRIGTKSITLLSEICNKETKERIAKGTSTVVYFDMEKQQSIALPTAYKERLLKAQQERKEN